CSRARKADSSSAARGRGARRPKCPLVTELGKPHRRLGPRPDTELLTDLANVNLHRGLGDEENPPDLLVRPTLRNEIDDFALSQSQEGRRRWFRRRAYSDGFGQAEVLCAFKHDLKLGLIGLGPRQQPQELGLPSIGAHERVDVARFEANSKGRNDGALRACTRS